MYQLYCICNLKIEREESLLTYVRFAQLGLMRSVKYRAKLTSAKVEVSEYESEG